jgi:hypothetical protein
LSTRASPVTTGTVWPSAKVALISRTAVASATNLAERGSIDLGIEFSGFTFAPSLRGRVPLLHFGAQQALRK